MALELLFIYLVVIEETSKVINAIDSTQEGMVATIETHPPGIDRLKAIS